MLESINFTKTWILLEVFVSSWVDSESFELEQRRSVYWDETKGRYSDLRIFEKEASRSIDFFVIFAVDIKSCWRMVGWAILHRLGEVVEHDTDVINGRKWKWCCYRVCIKCACHMLWNTEAGRNKSRMHTPLPRVRSITPPLYMLQLSEELTTTNRSICLPTFARKAHAAHCKRCLSGIVITEHPYGWLGLTFSGLPGSQTSADASRCPFLWTLLCVLMLMRLQISSCILLPGVIRSSWGGNTFRRSWGLETMDMGTTSAYAFFPLHLSFFLNSSCDRRKTWFWL